MKNILSLMLIIFSGNIESQSQTIVRGSISGLKDGSKVYLVSNGSKIWKDSTTVGHHKFYFKLNISEGGSYSIRLSKEYKVNTWKDFYIDEGLLIVNCKNANFDNCIISGSQYAREYNNYLTLLNSKRIYQRMHQFFTQEQEAEKRKDTALAYQLYENRKKLKSFRSVLGKEWISVHPSSPISSFILYNDIKDNVNLEELESLLNNLTFEAKDNILGKDMQNSVDASKATAIGKIAPDFTQNDTAGNIVSLKDFRGKYLLIDFWASWCIPCREENPNLIAAFKKYTDKGFTILSVSLDNDKNKWLQAIQKDNLIWTHISDLKFWDNGIAKQYDIRSLPSNLLLDPNGKIIAKNLRGEELNKSLSIVLK